MKRTSLILMLLVLGSLLLTGPVGYAQGWQRKFPANVTAGITSIYENADGTFIAAGGEPNGSLKQAVMKLSNDGRILWHVEHDSIQLGHTSNITQDGGLYIIGRGYTNASSSRDMVLLKVDKNGQKLWLKTIYAQNFTPPPVEYSQMDIDTTSNGGVICAFTGWNSGLNEEMRIMRYDGNGNLLWGKGYFTGDTTKYILSILNAGDGGFIVTSMRGFTDRPSLFKIDADGNMLWHLLLDVPSPSVTARVARDGNILITGNYMDEHNQPSFSYIGKVSQAGQQLWSKLYPIQDSVPYWYGNVVELPDNVFALICVGRVKNEIKFDFVKVDTTGILLRRDIPLAYYGRNASMYPGDHRTFRQTSDGHYILGGWIEQLDHISYSAFLMELDSNGAIYPYTIRGQVFADKNNNCIKSVDEQPVPRVIISFTNAQDTFMSMASASGDYIVSVNDSNFNVSVIPVSPYLVPAACNPAQVKLTTTDTVISFGLNPVVEQPYVSINAQMRNRICAANVYTAEYCNTGTAPFSGRIEIEMDTILSFDSASIPWRIAGPGKYVLDTVSLGMYECKKFFVYYHVPCDVGLMNRTLCVDAHLYSDTIVTQSPEWDGSNLEVKVKYDETTDSVQFAVKNIGKGPMSQPQDLVIIEDNVILLKTNVQLLPSAEFYQFIKANGSTWRANIQQTRDNPYSLFATAVIEGAGQNAVGGISKGFVNQFSNNGSYGFSYTTCERAVTSYDPNHKSVLPEGAGPKHIVEDNTDLEYTIRFQNTGNDTAYRVRLVDELAPYLDPLTIKPGISSHAYEMEFLSPNVVAFNFDNIYLADSATNEPGSNGFVKFKIRQVPGNTGGTVINNDAAIYFDYNPAIITNTATVTIGNLSIVGIENLYEEKDLLISAFPNPFYDKTIIKVEGERFNQLEMNVYDLAGRLIKQQRIENTNQFMLDRNGFSAGTYIFEIKSKNEMIGRGKIVAN